MMLSSGIPLLIRLLSAPEEVAWIRRNRIAEGDSVVESSLPLEPERQSLIMRLDFGVLTAEVAMLGLKGSSLMVRPLRTNGGL